MELKYNFNFVTVAMFDGSNRTFMELKFSSFNTFLLRYMF